MCHNHWCNRLPKGDCETDCRTKGALLSCSKNKPATPVWRGKRVFFLCRKRRTGKTQYIPNYRKKSWTNRKKKLFHYPGYWLSDGKRELEGIKIHRQGRKHPGNWWKKKYRNKILYLRSGNDIRRNVSYRKRALGDRKQSALGIGCSFPGRCL